MINWLILKILLIIDSKSVILFKHVTANNVQCESDRKPFLIIKREEFPVLIDFIASADFNWLSINISESQPIPSLRINFKFVLAVIFLWTKHWMKHMHGYNYRSSKISHLEWVQSVARFLIFQFSCICNLTKESSLAPKGVMNWSHLTWL